MLRATELAPYSKRIESAVRSLAAEDQSAESVARTMASLENCAMQLIGKMKGSYVLLDHEAKSTLVVGVRKWLDGYEIESIVEAAPPWEFFDEIELPFSRRQFPDEAAEEYRAEGKKALVEGQEFDALVAAANMICAYRGGYDIAYRHLNQGFLTLWLNRKDESRPIASSVSAAISTIERLVQGNYIARDEAVPAINVLQVAAAKIAALRCKPEMPDDNGRMDKFTESRAAGKELMTLFRQCGFNSGRRGWNVDHAAHLAVAIASTQGLALKVNTLRVMKLGRQGH